MIATDGNLDVVEFGLVGAYGGHHACVGYLEICGDVSFVDKKTMLVPEGMRVPTPWARRQRSLART